MSAPISFGFAAQDAVIVTGAASGIGRATALNAARLGLAVIAWDLDEAGVAATAETIRASGGRAAAVRADVTDQAQVEDALARSTGPASASELEFDAALTMAVGSMRRVTMSWLERAAAPEPALVNVSSVAGNVIGTAPDWYPAAKAAIMGYTRHLAAYRSDDVRANAVAPGMTDTPRLQGFAASDVGQRVLQRVPLHRLGTPEEISWAILFLLSPLASYVNGVLLTVDGGWTVTQ